MKRLLLLTVFAVGCARAPAPATVNIERKERLTTLWAKVDGLEITPQTTPEKLISVLGKPQITDGQVYKWGHFKAVGRDERPKWLDILYVAFDKGHLDRFGKNQPVYVDGAPLHAQEGPLMAFNSTEGQYKEVAGTPK